MNNYKKIYKMRTDHFQAKGKWMLLMAMFMTCSLFMSEMQAQPAARRQQAQQQAWQVSAWAKRQQTAQT